MTRRTLMSALTLLGLSRLAGDGFAAEKETETPPQASADELRRRMMAALPYEHVTVAGAQALQTWRALRAEGRGWPVVIGSNADLERLAEQFSSADPNVFPQGPYPLPAPRSPADILKAAAELHVPKDLAKWEGAYPPEDLTAPMGQWPDRIEAAPRLTVAYDIRSGQPLDQIHILLVPAKASWEVPAYLRWGNWNACPPAEYHVAALRDWHERFGAELVGINGDTLNLEVARPPRERAAAMALARDQYRYCPDIVDQGVETLSALAASLSVSSWWFFWWD